MKTQIAIITDPDQNEFMDRTVGNGTTWYYCLTVVDIAGGGECGDFIEGWSNP